MTSETITDDMKPVDGDRVRVIKSPIKECNGACIGKIGTFSDNGTRINGHKTYLVIFDDACCALGGDEKRSCDSMNFDTVVKIPDFKIGDHEMKKTPALAKIRIADLEKYFDMMRKQRDKYRDKYNQLNESLGKAVTANKKDDADGILHRELINEIVKISGKVMTNNEIIDLVKGTGRFCTSCGAAFNASESSLIIPVKPRWADFVGLPKKCKTCANAKRFGKEVCNKDCSVTGTSMFTYYRPRISRMDRKMLNKRELMRIE